jgi:osmotically-inducible protein OsmY
LLLDAAAVALLREVLLLTGVLTMPSPNDRVPDKTILKKVTQRLARSGLGSQSKIEVTVRNGSVTVTGKLQYEIQRKSVLNSARGVAGVRTIVDQLQAAPRKKNWC